MLPPALLWVDPGLMTGLAFYQSQRHPNWDTGVLPRFNADEFPFWPACKKIENVCAIWGNRLAMGWERFAINATTHKKTPQPDALHVIGVCRFLAARYECRVLPDAQQATPSKLEQEQLKALGWWVRGKDDAQSAAAHMLRYLNQANELPPKEREILAALGR